MNAKDTARCQQAIKLANSGQKQRAYKQFEELYYRYPDNVTLLYWIAYTTPSFQEAQDILTILARLEPHHPKLQELQQYTSRMQQSIVYAPSPGKFGPELQCPYCHHISPSRITQKVSVGGWIWLLIFFLLFLGCVLALVPTTQETTMGCMAFFSLLIGFIGLFFKKRSYTCGHCGIALGDIA